MSLMGKCFCMPSKMLLSLPSFTSSVGCFTKQVMNNLPPSLAAQAAGRELAFPCCVLHGDAVSLLPRSLSRNHKDIFSTQLPPLPLAFGKRYAVRRCSSYTTCCLPPVVRSPKDLPAMTVAKLSQPHGSCSHKGSIHSTTPLLSRPARSRAARCSPRMVCSEPHRRVIVPART